MRWLFAPVAASALIMAGCAGNGDVPLHVFAAASLTEAFEGMERGFEEAHPGVDVQFTFAGSADLASQIDEGAPADVFASANGQQMDAVRSAIRETAVFASNTLIIAVPKGNPDGIRGLDDLAADDVRLAICAPAVPCGAAAQSLAEASGVRLRPVSEESNVTDVLGKVASGEADAGIVYVTDIARAADVTGVAISGADEAINYYPIATVAGSAHPQLADAFVAWVLSESGQRELADHGFGAP